MPRGDEMVMLGRFVLTLDTKLLEEIRSLNGRAEELRLADPERSRDLGLVARALSEVRHCATVAALEAMGDENPWEVPVEREEERPRLRRALGFFAFRGAR